jgi:hypothetical protein
MTHRSLAALLAVILAFLASTPARAGLNTSDWQFVELWEDSEVSSWRLPPSIWLAPHARICADILALTPDQTSTLEGIVEGAEKEFMDAWLESKESLIDGELQTLIDDEDDENGYQSWRKRWKKWDEVRRNLHALRQKLFAQILTDLRLVVSPEQSDKWPELERAMRRSFSLLHLANLRFEGLDLDALIRGMDPSPETLQRIDPILTQYLIELDVLLSARDQAAATLEREAREARDLQEAIDDAEGESSRRDHSRAHRAGQSVVRAASTTLDASKRIADLNSLTLNTVQEHLPEDISAAIAKIVASPLYTRRNNDWDQTKAHAAIHLAENITTFSESLVSENIWSGTLGAQAGTNRLRAAVKPLTKEQSARIREIRARFETDDLALRARLKPEEDADPSRTTWLALRVPTGTVYLERTDGEGESSQRHQKREKEFRKKQAELILATIKDVRAVLDREQRMLIAAFTW